VIEHHIDTGNHRPIRLRPYRTPYKLRAEMQRHIDEMLKNDIIRPSVSPWASPALLVNKHDGSTRFVVDYRALNAITKFDSYPMPRITDILDQLRNKKILLRRGAGFGHSGRCCWFESSGRSSRSGFLSGISLPDRRPATELRDQTALTRDPTNA
jgi:hypothetical protein